MRGGGGGAAEEGISRGWPAGRCLHLHLLILEREAQHDAMKI